MPNKYETGQIMSDNKPKESSYCCLHKNLVPLEIGFANKTYPNGFNSDPNYNFAINIISANIVRVRSYLCLDCRMEIKAPNPDTIRKDRF